MKTCISTYSFAPLIWNKQLTYFDVLDKIKEFGADGVEFVMAEEVPHNGNPAEFTLRFAEAARKKGLDIPIYTTSANFLCRDVEERSGGWKKYRYCGRGGDPAHAPRYCRGLFMKDTKGCPLSRPSFPLWRLLFARWRITPRKKGVTTCSENHGRLFQDSDRMLRLFTEVNRPGYRYLCDIGNFGGGG